MTFYLGTHKPHWLSLVDVPLCVSHRTLRDRTTLPRALGSWLLDSGGFTELSLYGEWRTQARDFMHSVRRYAAEIGGMVGAACQDWMCEPEMLRKTGRAVREHQALTVASLLRLRHLAPELPWFPVLQGWEPDDYRRHLDAYARAGIDLTREALVGVGSVCRRQNTRALARVLAAVSGYGLQLHAFGVKTQGLVRAGRLLASADSMAWSATARRDEIRLAGCPHRTCANCLIYAMEWRAGVLAGLEVRPSAQMTMGGLF